MKYEEYIIAIAPFEDFKSRANNCSDDKFKSKLMEAYDKGLREVGRKILIENNITPNKLISQKCAGSTTGIIKYVTICNKLDNALSREPEVVIIIDGYVGMIHPFPISKIKKV